MNKAQSHKLRSLIKAEHQKLLAYVRSKIASLEESEDLLQDVYVQLLGNVNVLDSIDNLTGWLYTVTKNKVIDWYRKKRVKTVSIEVPIGDGIRFEDVLASELPESVDDEMRERVYQLILQSVNRLPEKQKDVFIDQVVYGISFRELSEMTGESINTLIARKRYAIQFLRSELKSIKKFLYET